MLCKVFQLRYLSKTVRSTLLNKRIILHTKYIGLASQHMRNYHDPKALMPRYTGKYNKDPEAVASHVIKLISLHDNAKNVNTINLNTQFTEIGLNELDLSEIAISIEIDGFISVPDEILETMKTVGDLVNFLAQNWFYDSV